MSVSTAQDSMRTDCHILIFYSRKVGLFQSAIHGDDSGSPRVADHCLPGASDTAKRADLHRQLRQNETLTVGPIFTQIRQTLPGVRPKERIDAGESNSHHQQRQGVRYAVHDLQAVYR